MPGGADRDVVEAVAVQVAGDDPRAREVQRIGRDGLGGPGGGRFQAVRTAVVNKRAGGMGLISGRKAFQRPMAEGAELLQAIQDVYLCDEVTIA